MNAPETKSPAMILRELGIDLPSGMKPKGSYAVVCKKDDLLYLSGQGPLEGDRAVYTGRVGGELTPEEGYQAARLAAINILGVLQDETGDLGRIRIIKTMAFVASAPGFFAQPAVVNGASDLFIQVLGEKGRSARSAIAAPQLPFDWTIEIEVIAQILESSGEN